MTQAAIVFACFFLSLLWRVARRQDVEINDDIQVAELRRCIKRGIQP